MTGGDGILKKLGFNAVMFVDVGRVEDGNPEYLTWQELGTVEESGRWELQLHSGTGTRRSSTGRAPTTGAVLRVREAGGGLRTGGRARQSDIDGAQKTLAEQIPGYQPLAFAPPYGNYGQDGTNDGRNPDELLAWLIGRYEVVFTQDPHARGHAWQGPAARPDPGQRRA